MNGNRYVLDTNAVIQLLRGNQEILKLVSSADVKLLNCLGENSLSFTSI